MPSKLQAEQPKDETKKEERASLKNLIREQVIGALGKPSDLHNVQVRKVWDDHYRVNVIVGADAGSVTVANSYFLKTDSDGNVITSSPKITKQY